MFRNKESGTSLQVSDDDRQRQSASPVTRSYTKISTRSGPIATTTTRYETVAVAIV